MANCLVLTVIFLLIPRADGFSANELVDLLLERTNHAMKSHGYDPYFLEDYYKVNLSLGVLQTKLGLFAGEVHNLSSMYRPGEASMALNIHTLGLDLHSLVGFTHVKVIYSYAALAVSMGLRGEFKADVQDMFANVTLSAYPATLKSPLKLEKFVIVQSSPINIEVSGFALLDPLVARLSNVFASFYEGVILKQVEEMLRNEYGKVIEAITPSELAQWGFSELKSHIL